MYKQRYVSEINLSHNFGRRNDKTSLVTEGLVLVFDLPVQA